MKSRRYIQTYFLSLLSFFIVASLSTYAFVVPTSYAQWSATYGKRKWIDVANSIQQTTDGGYIVAGIIGGGVGVLKLNSDGAVQWQRRYGGGQGVIGIVNGVANSIQQTSDGGYIMAGENSFSGDFWVSKLDFGGNIQWQKSYGGEGEDVARSIQQTTDGGYIVAGHMNLFSSPFSDPDGWVLKLNSDGDIQWQKRYGEFTRDDFANFIQQTSDGGYIMAGVASPDCQGDCDNFWVVKLNSNGTIQWQKRYIQRNNPVPFFTDFGEAFAIRQTTDGGYIMAGIDKPEGFVRVLKLRSDGTIQWQKSYDGGFPHFSDVVANTIWQTSDNGYILAGSTADFPFIRIRSDGWVLKLTFDGSVQWHKRYGGKRADFVNAIQQTGDGGYVAAGKTQSFSDRRWGDIWILKLKPDGTIGPSCDFITDASISVTNSTATVVDTSVRVGDTTVTPQTTSAIVRRSKFSPNIICKE